MAFRIVYCVQLISIGALFYSALVASQQTPRRDAMSSNLSTPTALSSFGVILKTSNKLYSSESAKAPVFHERTNSNDGGGTVNDNTNDNRSYGCDNATKSGNISCTEKEDDENLVYKAYVGILPTPFYLFVIYSILIMGLIGNVAIFTLMLLRFPGISYSVYIRFLAVMDSVVLITVCTEDIREHQFQKLSDANLKFCLVWHYMYNVTRLASPWLVVIFTLDRFITVAYPMSRLKLCTFKKAFIASGILIFVCITEGAILTAFTRENCDENGNDNTRRYYMLRLIGWESAIPCIAILVLNICIIVYIRDSLNIRKLFNETQSDTNSELSITLSLVAVSIMVFVTLIPTAVVEIMEFTYYETADEDEPTPTHIRNASDTWPLLNLIRLLNFGQNGYIMLMTSHKCRAEFKTLPLINRIFRRKHVLQEEGSQTANDTQMYSIG